MEKATSKDKESSLGKIAFDIGAIALTTYVGFGLIDFLT
jgi:hypothetical protein